MRKIIIGVLGPGDNASENEADNAFALGKLIAEQGWILLSGGRNKGAMDAVNQGAKSAGGLTVGIIPVADNSNTSEAVDVPIITGMGSARNNIIVLSCNMLIACGMSAGTASEVALALKAKKQVILLTDNQESISFFQSIGKDKVHTATNPQDAIVIAKKLLE